MKKWRQLSALLIAACMILLSGCGGNKEGTEQLQVGVCISGETVTLDPIYAEEIGDQTILTHLYENLLRVTADEAGKPAVEAGMARDVSVEKNQDGTVTCTFKLRSAKWSDGEDVRAQDFVYAWQRLANPSSNSPYASLMSVVCGYQEARNSKNMELLQVRAKNDSTLVVKLSGYYDWFLREVCTSPATMPLRQDVVQALKTAAMEKNEELPKGSESYRWCSDPLQLVTNGPYKAAQQTGSELILKDNPHYYGEIGPQALVFRYADNEEEAWLLYEQEKADVVWPLPENNVQALLEEEEWAPEAVLGTYSVVFNNAMLADESVRRALSLSLDRNSLAQTAGLLAHPAEGLVPPGVPDGEEFFRAKDSVLLDSSEERYQEACKEAVEAFAQVGYDAALDSLEYIYAGDDGNREVALEICRMWKEVLGIDVVPKALTHRELWAALRSGEYTLAGVELTAVSNDAECFLMNWTSESPDNILQYRNSAYDTLMAIIAAAPDGTARMGCLHDAEELLVEIDCALAPVYTEGTAWQVRDTLTGACRDARGWFSFADMTEREEPKKTMAG